MRIKFVYQSGIELPVLTKQINGGSDRIFKVEGMKDWEHVASWAGEFKFRMYNLVVKETNIIPPLLPSIKLPWQDSTSPHRSIILTDTMAAEQLEEILRMAHDDDDEILEGLEVGDDLTTGDGGADPEKSPHEGGTVVSPSAIRDSPANPNLRLMAGEPMQARSAPSSPTRAIPMSVRKRKADVGELGKVSKKTNKKGRKDKGKEPVITMVPLGERFLQQSLEQWKVDPFSASLRVISQYREVDKIHFEKQIASLRAELETEKQRAAGLEHGFNKKKEALDKAKELLEAAKMDALANGSKVKEAESKTEEAESQVRVLEEKVMDLEASVGNSSEWIRLLEQEIEGLKEEQAQRQNTESSPSYADLVNVPELLDRLRRTLLALRDSKAKNKEAGLKGLKLYRDGFEEALKQVALVHPSVELPIRLSMVTISLKGT